MPAVLPDGGGCGSHTDSFLSAPVVAACTSGTRSASVSRFSNRRPGPGSQPVAPAFSAGSSSASTARAAVWHRERGRRRRQAAEVRALQQVLAQLVRARQLDGVLAGEAGGAEAFARLPGGVDHAVLGDVGQRIGADGLGDLLDGGAVGDQFGAGGEVDAVEAGPLDRRGGDLDVDARRRRLRGASGRWRAGCCRGRSSRPPPPRACRGSRTPGR